MRSPSDRIVHRRPRSGQTLRVWEIADEITREKGRPARRSEVRERFVAEDGNENTANTQYQHWKSWLADGAAAAAPRDVRPKSLRVAPDGRFLIPVEMREAMRLDPDGRIVAQVRAGQLRLVSQAVAVEQVQARMRQYARPGERVVDRFLAERRFLWGER